MLQFTVFLFGWIIKVIYYALMVWLATPGDLHKYEFIGAFLNASINPFWNIYPIAYILYQHRKVFKHQLKQPTILPKAE